jgi:hypothetical protein
MWSEENTHRTFVHQQWSVILLLLARNKPSVPVTGGCHINCLDTNPARQSAMSACYVVPNSLITFCGVLYGAFSLVDYRPTALHFRISDDQEGFGKKSSDVTEMLSFDLSKFFRKTRKTIVCVVFAFFLDSVRLPPNKVQQVTATLPCLSSVTFIHSYGVRAHYAWRVSYASIMGKILKE